MSALPWLKTVCILCESNCGVEVKVDDVARLFFEIGERFGFDWLREAADGYTAENAWQQAAREVYLEGVFRYQARLTRSVLGLGAREGWRACLERWESGREDHFETIFP